jgi:hypothetical protein
MKAFISYSINDKDQVIVTLLSNNLRKQGFQIITSQNFYNNILDYTTKIKIDNSRIYFGIITKYGREKNRVITEWKYAKKMKIPNILLIENSVNLNKNFTGNYIVFDRNNPQKAINKIQQRMTNVRKSNTSNNDNVWPWIIGGAALLGIIGLLSKDE